MAVISTKRLDEMSICNACAGLNGKPRLFDPGRDRGEQRCSCQRDPDEPGWDGYDISEYVHVCECCLQEVLASGSKFSVWFCEECKDRVVALNDSLRVWLIPIGRHTFMARTYDPPGFLALSGPVLTKRGPASDAEIRRFLDASRGLFSTMDRLHAWSKASLLGTIRELGFPPDTDVRLSEYLRTIRAAVEEGGRFSRRGGRYSKEAAFDRLRVYMLDGHVATGR